MATWTDVSSTVLEPGDPIRSVDIIAIKEKIIAVPEGVTGAPRIVGLAAKLLADFPVLTVSASDAFSAANGNNFVSGTTTTSSTANPPTVVAYSWTIEKYTGSIRFKASHSGSPGLEGTVFQSTLAIYKNNVLIQSFNNNTTSFVERIVDVSIVPGDIVQWRHRTNSSAGVSYVTGRAITASDGYTTRSLFVNHLQENTP